MLNLNLASGSAGQFGTEFASETNAAEVKQQNAQSASAQEVLLQGCSRIIRN